MQTYDLIIFEGSTWKNLIPINSCLKEINYLPFLNWNKKLVCPILVAYLGYEKMNLEKCFYYLNILHCLYLK